MIILGINEGHNASAALLVDGRLISAISEDRPSRQTTRGGFPFGAVQQCLDLGGITRKDIDHVAIATHHLPPKYFLVPRETFSVEDYRREQMEFWAPRINGTGKPAFLDVFKDKIDESHFVWDRNLIKNEDDVEGMLEARLRHHEVFFGIDRSRISVHDHHACHAFYGYCSNKNQTPSTIVFTADGGGDRTNGTVWVGRRGAGLKEIFRTDQCNVGRMYRYATLMLGMKQFEHAYKVMGLAPYANEKIGRKAYAVYAETLQVEGLKFTYKVKPNDNFFHFKSRLDGMRFDGVAWGIQRRTEELLSQWVANGIAETGIKNVVMSGGVAMNIKANMTIWGLDQVQSLYVPPGSGDESLSIGAAYKAASEAPTVPGEHIDAIEPMTHAYLGTSFSSTEVEKRIAASPSANGCDVRRVAAADVAAIIASGEVVSRFAGRGEFGPRALGNRSILADARDNRVVRTINEMIKQRDFWMPFAASIKAERMDDYIVNPKRIDSRFMTIAFDSTAKAQVDMPSGLHPYDQTCRPQIISRDQNAGYHELITEFEKRTGIGALLNTSFNLHGEPIVSTPEEALSTFARSGLNHVLIEDVLVSKPVA